MNDYLPYGKLDNNLTLSDWDDVLSDPCVIRGVDLGVEDHYGISIDGKTLKEVVEEAVKEILKEEETKETPRIEKYHMKHK